MADLSHHSSPRLIRIVKVRVRQSRVASLRHTEYLGRPFGLLLSQLRAPAGAGFSGGQVQYPGPVSAVHRLEQRTGTGQLDVVAVRGNGQDVDRHEGNKA